MVGATASTDGEAGLVPAPEHGKENFFLRGDATWADPTAGLTPTINSLVGRMDGAEDALDLLQGTDYNKSIRAIAQEEVAGLVANAPTSFDTLKEIADWISSHEDVASLATLQNDVADLKDIIYDIPAELDPVTGDVITPAHDGLVTRVEDLEDTINGTANTDGLVAQVSDISDDLAALQGQFATLSDDVGDLSDLLNGDGEPNGDPGLISRVTTIEGRLQWQDLVEDTNNGE